MPNRYRIIIIALLLALSVSVVQVIRIRRALAESKPTTIGDSGSLADGVGTDSLPPATVEPPRIDWLDSASLGTQPRNSTVTLVVQVAGVRPDAGKILIALFDDGGVFPDRAQALQTKSATPDQPRVRAEIPGLPAGDYAAAVFQDTNSDGVLNRNAFGIPSEPYGFSNDARGRFGPPAFPPLP